MKWLSGSATRSETPEAYDQWTFGTEIMISCCTSWYVVGSANGYPKAINFVGWKLLTSDFLLRVLQNFIHHQYHYHIHCQTCYRTDGGWTDVVWKALTSCCGGSWWPQQTFCADITGHTAWSRYFSAHMWIVGPETGLNKRIEEIYRKVKYMSNNWHWWICKNTYRLLSNPLAERKYLA